MKASIVASWRTHCELLSSAMPHWNFRREVTVCLLKSARAAQSQIRGLQVLLNVRYDGVGHFPNLYLKDDAKFTIKTLGCCE